MATVNVTINGRKVQARAGQTVLEAATEAGIHIPVLCHHPALPPEGACRMCLVEIEKQRALQPACTFPVSEGLVIYTHSAKVVEARRFVLELLISDHPLDCMTCDATGDCLLQDLAYEYGVKGDRYPGRRHQYPVDDPNPFIQVDRNKCILCRRCVRACNYINGVEAISVVYRGFNARIAFGTDSFMADSPCEFCGSCVAVCPTAALWPKMAIGQGRPWQLRRIETICSYCGVGCRIALDVKDNKIVKVESAWDGPANHGWTCVKGRFGYDYVNHPDRLTRPLVRREILGETVKDAPTYKDTDFVETDWETALTLVATRFMEVKRTHGGDAWAMLCSAKCTNEENYLMQKMARQIMGTHNVDHCARLCHSTTVTGLAAAFGSGAMTNSMDDIANEANLYFVIGSNTTEQHPVLGFRIRQAVKQRGAVLIVADPRRIPLVDFATLHLKHRPGTDVALLNGLMNVLITEDLYDHDFVANRTEGFDDLKAVVKKYTPEVVAEITGVPADDLRTAARLLADRKPGALLYSMGITQHTSGHNNVLSIANLQMLLGNLGVPGGGVNPLRGQVNVQGACDMGALPNVFPGYQSVTNPELRAKFEQAWGLPVGSLPAKPGLTVVEMTNAACEGKIKAMYIVAENPMMTDPDINHVREALNALDFLVVQDLFLTETAQLADVVLPGTSFAEKTGTFTNTERRVQLGVQAIQPIGDARPDWMIVCELAKRMMEMGDGRWDKEARFAGWEYASPAQIMDEIAALTPSYGGISHARLGTQGLQWPCPHPEHPGTPILHVGQFTRGLGKFSAVEHLPPAELPDEEYPYLLTTGRMLYHYHGGSLTRRAKALDAHVPEGSVEVNPEDAARLGIADGELVHVASRRGEVWVKAEVTDKVEPGIVFMTFHFAEAAANLLTNPALDPVAKIPEYKACAVRLEKAQGRSCRL